MSNDSQRKSSKVIAASQPMVAVVIVGYNGRELVTNCLASLHQLNYSNLSIVYVDNGSTDGSLDCIRRTYPNVSAFCSGGNLGYCGGNNVGIHYALENHADFILLLNADTLVCNPDFLKVLVTYMIDNDCVGKCGPKVYLREKGRIQNTVLLWPSISRKAKEWLFLRTTAVRSGNDSVEAESINGCCVLIRSESIRQVGLYDERFWGYIDEADWDWRAEKMNWSRHYVPVDSIVHLQKLKGYQMDDRVNFLLKRNTALWFRKTGAPVSMLIWMFSTSAIAFMRSILALFRGRSMKSYLSFWITLQISYMAILVGNFDSDWYGIGGKTDHPDSTG